MDLSDKDQLISYLKANGLWAKKGLGQNFLVDKNVLQKIVEAAELSKDDLIIEVGPGTGVLTAELVKKAGRVVAIEKDEKLASLLHCSIAGLLTPPRPPLEKGRSNITMQQCNNLTIVNDDILKVNLGKIIADKKYKVVANIPYYITSKILELFLSREEKPESIVLLVQKEVAERICAKAGEMSVLSVSVQLYGEPEIVDVVQASSFFPAPKVDSAILRVKNIKQPTNISEKNLFQLVHIGFSSRRKTLVNNLSAGYRIDKKTASDIIKKSGFKENIRAQELTIADWEKLLSSIDF